MGFALALTPLLAALLHGRASALATLRDSAALEVSADGSLRLADDRSDGDSDHYAADYYANYGYDDATSDSSDALGAAETDYGYDYGYGSGLGATDATHPRSEDSYDYADADADGYYAYLGACSDISLGASDNQNLTQVVFLDSQHLLESFDEDRDGKASPREVSSLFGTPRFEVLLEYAGAKLRKTVPEAKVVNATREEVATSFVEALDGCTAEAKDGFLDRKELQLFLTEMEKLQKQVQEKSSKGAALVETEFIFSGIAVAVSAVFAEIGATGAVAAAGGAVVTAVTEVATAEGVVAAAGVAVETAAGAVPSAAEAAAWSAVGLPTANGVVAHQLIQGVIAVGHVASWALPLAGLR